MINKIIIKMKKDFIYIQCTVYYFFMKIEIKKYKKYK